MASNPKNPIVFFDIQVGKRQLGRLVFELFADTNPKTAENFRSLCTGERGTSVVSKKKLSYQHCPFHRVISGFMAQGGDITRGDGTGGESIFGASFPDENFLRPHDAKGLLSMANSGPDTNGSQFFLTFRDTPHLNGRHVVFGQVIEGMELVAVLENVSTDAGDRPRAPVTISQCGQIGQELPPQPQAQAQSVGESHSASASSSGQGVGQSKDEDKEHKEPEEEEEPQESAAEREAREQREMAGMTPAQQRLFKLRLRINQGRKLNQAETEREYKMASDPSFAKKERAAERQQRQQDDPAKAKGKGKGGKAVDIMSQTAGECEQIMSRKAAKERNVSSFGWEAFTAEASYRAYNKGLASLPTSSSAGPSGSSSSGAGAGAGAGANPLAYGKQGTEITANALNRLTQEIEGKEATRAAYSRRRTSHEATTIDHISDRNEHFNKKLKRTLDKYTVEIRQNLERGTAL